MKYIREEFYRKTNHHSIGVTIVQKKKENFLWKYLALVNTQLKCNSM